MTLSDNDLHELVRSLDPTIADAAPHPGSDRFAAIRVRAVTEIPGDSLQTSDLPPGDGAAPATLHDRSGRRTPWRYLAVAASVAAAVLAFTALAPGQTPDAAAAVAAAAANVGEVDSLRASYARPNGINAGFAELEYSNGDIHLAGTYTDLDNNGELSMRQFESTIVGDTRYDVLDGDGKIITSDATSKEAEDLAPFPASAEDVVMAALTSAEVTDVGTEQVRGVEATHYEVRVDDQARDSLNALRPAQLLWFGLDIPDSVEQIDLWVGDGLIRRITVTKDGSGQGEPQDTSTTEFYDFGADITIEPPTADR